MLVEKWPAPDVSEAPLSVFLQALEAGHIRMTLNIAQGPLTWERASVGGRTIMQRILASEATMDLAPTS